MAATARRPRQPQGGPAVKRSSGSIGNFARISKRVTPAKCTIGKDTAERIVVEKARDTAIEIILPSAATAAAVPPTSRKRKAADTIESGEASTTIVSKSTTAASSAVRSVKRVRRQIQTILGAPEQLPKVDADGDVDLSETQRAGALLERLKISSSPARSSTPLTPSTAITSPCESDPEPDAQLLPQELADLVNLHSSLLKTLGLHYAHHGTNIPVDIRTLCPSVAQAWGKRKVTLDDIRKCVGVLDQRTTAITSTTGDDTHHSPFFLSDYGRGKICIELHGHAGPGLLDEKLVHHFERNLRTAWLTKRGASDVEQFIADLPKASITTCDSLAKASPLLSKGQRTLEELKNGIAMRKQEHEMKKATAKQAAEVVKLDGSKMDLLDRIRFRQLQQTQGDGSCRPATAAELEKRAALQRVGDIAAVISMLVAATAMGQKRLSFTMAAVLTKLKDSLRLPISREEGAACVRLLAREIAPQWLKLVTIGGKENVVVLTDFTPSKAAIQERVRAAGASSSP